MNAIKTKILLLIFILIGINIQAQTDAAFWNRDMQRIAKSSSVNGWVQFKPEGKIKHQDFFQNNKAAFGLKNDDDMVLVQTHSDDLDLVHYKYQHTYKGIPIEGCEYILHTQNDKVISANGKLACDLDKDVTPNISEQDALNKVLNDIDATKYGWEALNGDSTNFLTSYPKGELLLCHLINNGDFTNLNYQLSYRFEVVAIEPIYLNREYYIDAKTGDIIKQQSLLAHKNCNCCNGNASTLYNGGQNITTKALGFPFYNFLLKDECRGNGIQSYYNGKKIRDPNNNFANNHKDKTAASAHWAIEETYDYFLINFGRSSFDGYGAKIECYAGHSFSGQYPGLNASWSPTEKNIRLGFGHSGLAGEFVSLDIMAHEFTHGLTQHTAGLVYAGESGALNESFSDIFGVMVEYYASNGDYEIGEDVITTTDPYWLNKLKRSLSTPNSFNDPDTYDDGVFWVDPTDLGNDNGGVHTNSGVQNYWFYLLSEGGTGTNDHGQNYSVQGIGRDKAAAIAYRNLLVYLTSTSDYSDAKNGAIWSAMDLYGACSNEVIQTIKAWDAVGVSSNGGIGYDVFVNCSFLNIIHNQGSPYTARAIRNLESNCVISTNTNASVTFIAGKSIALKTGFSTGSGFHAYLDTCLSDIQLKRPVKPNEANDKLYTNNRSSQRTDNHVQNDLTEEINSSFRIYPNPTNGKMTIELPDFEDSTLEIFIHNTTGELIDKKQITGNSLAFDLSDEPRGVYFINFTKNGKRYTKKVIIQ